MRKRVRRFIPALTKTFAYADKAEGWHRVSPGVSFIWFSPVLCGVILRLFRKAMFAGTPFRELSAPEFGGGYAQLLGENPGEIVDRLEAALGSDVLDGQIPVQEHLRGQLNPAFLNVMDEGLIRMLLKQSRQMSGRNMEMARYPGQRQFLAQVVGNEQLRLAKRLFSSHAASA